LKHLLLPPQCHGLHSKLATTGHSLALAEGSEYPTSEAAHKVQPLEGSPGCHIIKGICKVLV
jgi:hypothetical protein